MWQRAEGVGRGIQILQIMIWSHIMGQVWPMEATELALTKPPGRTPGFEADFKHLWVMRLCNFQMMNGSLPPTLF